MDKKEKQKIIDRKAGEAKYDKDCYNLKGQLYANTKRDPSRAQLNSFNHLVDKHWDDLNTDAIEEYVKKQKKT